MNSECKTYRLNEPMKWAEFLAMPVDVQKIYVYALRKKFKVPNADLGRMMGVERTCISNHLMRHGFEKAPDGRCKWDKDGFYAWWNGVDKLPTPAIEEVAITQEEKEKIFFGEEKGYVEDDLPFEEPDLVPVDEARALRIQISELLRVNEELKAVHEKDKQENAWLRNECDRYHRNNQMLEAQMEVVRMIFGGKNHD